MTLHFEEPSKEKKLTLGSYLVDKLGGKLGGEDGGLFDSPLELKIENIETTMEQLKESIVDYSISRGFSKSYDGDSKLKFGHKESSVVPVVIYSYFKELRLCRVSVRREF